MPKVSKIYLLRHAKPDIKNSTVPTKNCGIIIPSDQTLSRLIQQLPVNSRLIHSPLKRAVETLACLTKSGLKSSSIEENNSFSEQDLGFLEGTTYEDAWHNLSMLKPHNWAFFPANYRPEGGESFIQVTERVVISLNKVIRENDGRPITIICHSGVIRSIIGMALNLDHDVMLSLQFDHLSLSHIEYRQETNLGGHYQVGFLNRLN